MKSPFALAAAAAVLAASLASAGIVITPIFSDQVVGKSSGDCFFGVVTPQGCGPKRG
ncbi:Secreted virulence factor mc69 [Purpureocillium takamizusanense]|uniref:Secreted virulence factor mc69 n=1 Tax=Purpureocillium takamizusanense TaxID=2060973 RepID=A0A9Q8VG51_9HYPO|nr:Secreted virulence factor mc69 [Purpureocillium takamizusanense]UNI24171.1 Secreted virulence factor mc69 [Purpureocillium takamizusanense]